MTDVSVDTAAVIKHYIKTLYCRKRSLEIRFCLNSEAMPSCNESLSPAKLKAVFVPESVAFSPFHDVIPVKTKPFHYTLKYRLFAIIFPYNLQRDRDLADTDAHILDHFLCRATRRLYKQTVL